MRKRRIRTFLWFLGMGAFVILAMEIVNGVRKDRGEEQVAQAYQLLDQGEFSEAITRLEDARESYRLADKHFPEMDTLFSLYIRIKDWEKAERTLHRMSRHISDEQWLLKMVRLAEKVLTDAPELAVSLAYEIINVDGNLNMIPYPASLDAVLGEAMEERLLSSGEFQGFRRISAWSTRSREWWYYEANDGEEIEYQHFAERIRRALRDREEVVIDAFVPLRDSPYRGEINMGFVGRVVYSGRGLQDSSFLSPQEALTDSLDRSGERLQYYADLFGWEYTNFLWNTVLLSPPQSEPYYEHVPYLMLKERISTSSSGRLMQIAEDRLFIVRDGTQADCYDQSPDVACWTIDPYWLQGMPDEFVQLWKDHFPASINQIKPPQSAEAAKRLALSRDLAVY